MKTIKYVLYALGALVAVLAIVVAIVVATFDPNAYKPQIVQLVKDQTGRTLTIDGDIGLKIFPKIGAQLGRVTLSERGGEAEFAGLDRMQVYLALLPLLSREVVVDTVRIDGLRANLVKFKDGSTNFADLAGGGEKPAAAPVQEPAQELAQPAKPIRLEVSGVTITDSRLSWKDETNGNDLTIELSQLSTGRIADKTPSKLSMSAAVKGAQPKVDLQATLTGTLAFDLAGQRYKLDALEAKLAGAALDFHDIAVGLEADVEAGATPQRVAIFRMTLDGKASRGKDVYNLKLSVPAIESTAQALAIDGLALSASGQISGLQLADAKLAMPVARINLERGLIQIEGLALTAKAKAGADTLDVSLSAPKLAITPEQAGGASVSLAAKLAGAQRNADVTLELSGVEGSAKALRIAALKLGVDARQQDSAVKGNLATPVIGNLEARVFELPKLAGSFTVRSPAIPQKTVTVPLSGLVRADLTKERVFADLVTRFDESNIKAKGGITRFARPAYDFDVTIDRLNVDRYRTAAKPEAERAEPQPSGPEQPIDLSALQPLDLNGSLKVGALQANNVKASNVRVDVRAKDGRLAIDPLSAKLYEGSTAGAIGIDANTNRFTVKQTLSAISIGPLLRDAVQKDILEGKGTIALDLATQGNLVSAMKKAIQGKAQLALKDGAVKGIDLAGAVRNAKAKFGGKDAEAAAARTEQTDFSELTASFDIRNGVARSDDLSLKSPFLRVTGAGEVDIAQDSLDYTVKTSIVGTTAGQGGKELGELKGFTIPVRVYGPYTALKYKVSMSQMFGGKEQLEAVKQTAKEAAKGKLQNLLGGQPPAQPESGPAQPESGPAQPAAPTGKPEEELKKKLKGLFR